MFLKSINKMKKMKKIYTGGRKKIADKYIHQYRKLKIY